MKSKSEMVTMVTGAKVEVATITMLGRDYTATGSVIAEDAGVIVGYPYCVGFYPFKGFEYELLTWSGDKIGALEKTGKARGFHGSEITCWAMTYGGKRYSGRNAGTGMVLRLRTKV